MKSERAHDAIRILNIYSEISLAMADSAPKDGINIMKYVSLVALTLQNAFVALSMRHGRTRVEKERLFFSSTGKQSRTIYCMNIQL